MVTDPRDIMSKSTPSKRKKTVKKPPKHKKPRKPKKAKPGKVPQPSEPVRIKRTPVLNTKGNVDKNIARTRRRAREKLEPKNIAERLVYKKGRIIRNLERNSRNELLAENFLNPLSTSSTKGRDFWLPHFVNYLVSTGVAPGQWNPLFPEIYLRRFKELPRNALHMRIMDTFMDPKTGSLTEPGWVYLLWSSMKALEMITFVRGIRGHARRYGGNAEIAKDLATWECIQDLATNMRRIYKEVLLLPVPLEQQGNAVDWRLGHTMELCKAYRPQIRIPFRPFKKNRKPKVTEPEPLLDDNPK